MFYTIFAELCRERGIKPGRAAGEIGVSRAAVTRWKQDGYTPRSELLEKISAYFGVSADYLLHGRDAESDSEMDEYLNMLKTRPECRMLFSLAKNATTEDVTRAVRIIEALRDADGAADGAE